VAAGARGRAASTAVPGLAAQAGAAGLLHDLGKYRAEFQQYVRGLRYHRGDPLTRHKEAGAARAFDAGQNPIALAVLGHHGGIPDGSEIRPALTAGRPVGEGVWGDAVADLPELATALDGLSPAPPGFAADLFVRVLFSCLVDADWANTAEHERVVKGRPADPPPPPLDPATRLARVEAFVAGLANRPLEPHVRAARAAVLAACLAAAANPPGLYSLTVPTGGGKTLAAFAFALKHATTNGLRRVIYIAPYTTILEQNADVIRAALGVERHDPAVLEHHNLAEPPGDGDAAQTDPEAAARWAENWDAPVVVTTNVQFFESLFSNKPGRCRKVHNVAGSVVVLDECQALPPGLVAPTCGMLRQLAAPAADGGLGCTVVLCTATQPAFDHDLLKPDERLAAAEIIPPGAGLFESLKRVAVTWPKRDDARLSWADVAVRMRGGRSALCVVNTKKAARAVYAELAAGGADGVFHLSTGMCPQHRREKLDVITDRLKNERPCHVVSTPLIEAGVDVDFPFLMRELAPLESVIQAAGRCNREGRRAWQDSRVVVFRSEEGKLPPDDWYRRGTQLLGTDFLNEGDEPRIDVPEDIRRYYRKLYRSGQLDKPSIQAKRLEEKYATVATDYKLIKDDTVSVLVTRWAPHQAKIASLLVELDRRPRKEIRRRLAAFQVNVFRQKLGELKPHIDDTRKDGLLLWTSRYDESFGLDEKIDDEWCV
jgi:CRISPR-associated endonuclease/helicase Cas3